MSDPAPPTDTPRRSRWLLGGLAALIPIVPIVIGLLITGAGASHTATAARGSAAASVSAPSTASKSTSTHRSPSDLPSGHGAIVAYVTRSEPIRTAPGGRTLATVAAKTGFGSPTSLLVRKVKGRWLGVVSVAAGNNRLGWIERSQVSLVRDSWSLHAILSRHQLRISHDGRVVQHYAIATGKPSAPTPTGTFAVTDRLTTDDDSGPYGCCILALSAKAPHAISDWDGGNRIAIHSYPITSTIGESVSHGCMHVTNAEGQWLLHHIPLGTPVVISSA